MVRQSFGKGRGGKKPDTPPPPAPTWAQAPVITVTAGSTTPQNLPVSAGSAAVTVTWLATSTPSTKPDWLDFTAGPTPQITFDGSQADEDDLAGPIYLRATANSQTDDSDAGSITVNAAASGDWATRSSGALVASRIDSQSVINDWLFANGGQGAISFDASVKPDSDSAGSLKMTVPNEANYTGGPSYTSPQLSVPFGTSFGEGDTFWVSYRVRQPITHAYAPWPESGGGDAAHKLSILSRDGNGTSPSGSNQENEIVIQQNAQAGEIAGYRRRQPDDDYASFVGTKSTAYSGSDTVYQKDVDNGTPTLTGTNPDTGSAWTTGEQDRHRYSSSSGGRVRVSATGEFADGYGDPFSGGFRAYPDEWLTITMRVTVGTWGEADSRVTVWAARPDEPYVLLWDEENDTLGSSGVPDYNGINFTPYTTNRLSGGRQVGSRGGQVTGIEITNVGPDVPTGSGTLTWTASTQQLKWRGAGESDGQVVGFSATNDILIRNVKSASGDDTNFLQVRATPASFSGSDQTETVTIADERPDTYLHYADVIISTEPILAPGLYWPTGTFPSWYPASAGTIVAIGTNTLNDVVTADLVGTTGHSGGAYEVMSDWCGGALVYKDGLPYLFVAGAGHGHSINGLYKFGPLTSDLPVWSIENAMSRTASTTLNGSFPNSDNKPTASHTYNVMAGYGSKMYQTGIHARYLDANMVQTFLVYDTDTEAWSSAGSNVPWGSSVTGAAVVAAGQVFYTGGSASSGYRCIYDLDASSWTQSEIGSGPLFNGTPASCYDPVRGVIFTYGFLDGGGWRYETINVSTLSRSWGTPGTVPNFDSNAMEYDPERDCYVIPGVGNQYVYELDPDALTFSTRTFSGATPDAGHTENNGHFGRFRYVPELKGYIYAPSHNGQVFFYRST